MTRYNVGDEVWLIQSGNTQRWVECPDCLGQLCLTVILGDGSQVSIDCDCCRAGYGGCRGMVLTYVWHCGVISRRVTGMQIDGEKVEYKFVDVYHPDNVYATKEEAEAAMVGVLAQHEADEAHRFAHVKDRQGRNHTWAWNVTYHRRSAKEAKRQLEYHESKLAVANAKAKLPETKEAA